MVQIEVVYRLLRDGWEDAIQPCFFLRRWNNSAHFQYSDIYNLPHSRKRVLSLLEDEYRNATSTRIHVMRSERLCPTLECNRHVEVAWSSCRLRFSLFAVWLGFFGALRLHWNISQFTGAIVFVINADFVACGTSYMSETESLEKISHKASEVLSFDMRFLDDVVLMRDHTYIVVDWWSMVQHVWCLTDLGIILVDVSDVHVKFCLVWSRRDFKMYRDGRIRCLSSLPCCLLFSLILERMIMRIVIVVVCSPP